MTMAMDLVYSVEVKSRFALFAPLDEENQNEGESIQAVEHESKKSTAKSQQKNNSRPPLKQSATDNRVTSTGPVYEHQKEEHKQKHNVKGHHPPSHGREFDRKSGSNKTGIKSVPKKEGYGAGNWGTVQDELDATMTEDAPADPLNISSENAVEGEENELAAPEPVTMTLEEWKAQQKQGHLKPTAEQRAPNDGKDVFRNMKIVKPVKLTSQEENLPKFASVYQTTNESGIRFITAPQGGDRSARGTRGGRGGQRGARPQVNRSENNQTERLPREDKPHFERPVSSRGGRGAPGSGRGVIRGAASGGPPLNRGGRGNSRGAINAGPTRSHNAAPVQIMNEKDFPSLC